MTALASLVLGLFGFMAVEIMLGRTKARLIVRIYSPREAVCGVFYKAKLRKAVLYNLRDARLHLVFRKFGKIPESIDPLQFRV